MQCKSMPLSKHGGAPRVSTVVKEWLFHAGLAEGGLCLALNNSHLPELVETVWMRTLLDGHKGTVWAVCPSVRAKAMPWGLVFALTCLLFSSHHGDLTFSSTKRKVEPEVPWFIDVVTQLPSPWISCDTRPSQLKILQGLSKVPMVDLTPKPPTGLLWLRWIRLNFQEALGGMTACEWHQGGRVQIMSPISPLATGENRTYLLNPKMSSLVVSCVG